jgi:secondary thiamine-phosphate synthase enzyme
VREITVTTERRTHVVDITAQVRAALTDAGEAAAVLLYVPHTTAGIVLQEHAGSDPAVATDLEMAMERVVQDDWPWEHYEPGNVNPWAHSRAALTATSVTVPLSAGELALGTYQGIFLCEFDGPKTRRVYVTLLA